MFVILIIFALLSSMSFAAEIDAEAVIRKLDALYRSESSRTVFEMQIVTPNWERTLSLEAWSKGMDKTFILINSPIKEKGTATLRVGNQMWNYLPKTDKVMLIPPSMMMGSWMGSDFTNDDLVRESSLLEEYSHELFKPDGAEPGLVYLKLVPKEETPSVWGEIHSAVRESDYLPVWQNFYDEKGRLQREIYFREIKRVGGREIPTIMELIPTNKKGQKTIIKYVEVEFDIKIDDRIFTLENLQKKR